MQFSKQNMLNRLNSLMVVALALTFSFSLNACNDDDDGESVKYDAANYGILPEISGTNGTTYEHLFSVINAEKWTGTWMKYAAALVGDSAAAGAVQMLQSSITGELYGAEATAEYGEHGDKSAAGYRFNCELLGAKTINFNKNVITIVTADDKTVSNTYEYVGKKTVGEGETLKYNGMDLPMAFEVDVYKSTKDAGEFTYFLMRDDTMDKTWHIELRYGRNLDETSKYLVGPYAYWQAAGIEVNASDETIDNVIKLFVQENLGGGE